MKYGDYGVQNAIIESAAINIERGGILDVSLQLCLEGGSQSFGGWSLYLDRSFANHKMEGIAGHHIFRVMKIAGVEHWDKLKGKSIRVRGDSNKLDAIGHIVKDDWFCPKEEYAGLTKTT